MCRDSQWQLNVYAKEGDLHPILSYYPRATVPLGDSIMILLAHYPDASHIQVEEQTL